MRTKAENLSHAEEYAEVCERWAVCGPVHLRDYAIMTQEHERLRSRIADLEARLPVAFEEGRKCGLKTIPLWAAIVDAQEKAGQAWTPKQIGEAAENAALRLMPADATAELSSRYDEGDPEHYR